MQVKPQPGPQEAFLSTSADIAIYGGMAGGGKTWAELFEPLRHILPSKRFPKGVPNFSGVIFRRTAPQIRNEGGLWDESMKLYPLFDGKPKETILEWQFPEGQTMRFASMQHEQNKNDWQGAQIPYIAFDELTHFTEEQFFYLMSRNRSLVGIRPYMRATCNPDADSWVADFISWWIDQDEHSSTYGLAIPERAGVIRYFIRQTGVIRWADRPEDLYQYLQHFPDYINRRDLVKSVTFIPASIYDNRKLLEVNPEYLGSLEALPYVERMRLLGGNWKIRPSSGNIFNREWWNGKIVDAAPAEAKRVRYWDKAATDEEEAYESKTPFTAGVRVSRTRQGLYYVEDVRRAQLSPGKRNRMIEQTALEDGHEVKIWLEQEPGSGGKESAQISVRGLAGFTVRSERVTGDKVARAMPASAQVEAGNVYLVRGPWNKDFMNELHAFPNANIKDQVDGFSGAMNKLMKRRASDPDDFTPHTR